MSYQIYKYYDNIVRIHTDSVYLKKNLEHLPINKNFKIDSNNKNKLGYFKFEGYCKDMEIINNAKVIGKFIK